MRPAPEGWVRARTNAEALQVLRTGEVTEASLDYDLDLRGDETGYDLAVAMVLEGLVPGSVTIHSWNAAESLRIAACLRDAGYECELRPASPETASRFGRSREVIPEAE
jgi:hypothetical protein